MKQFFKQTADSIIAHVKDMLDESNRKGGVIGTILMVGGFSESPYGIVTSVGCAVKPLFFPSNVRLIANMSSGFCFMNSLHTSVGHHYTHTQYIWHQQTTGGEDEPNIVYMRNSSGHHKT
jgi:hypothetical protein